MVSLLRTLTKYVGGPGMGCDVFECFGGLKYTAIFLYLVVIFKQNVEENGICQNSCS